MNDYYVTFTYQHKESGRVNVGNSIRVTAKDPADAAEAVKKLFFDCNIIIYEVSQVLQWPFEEATKGTVAVYS